MGDGINIPDDCRIVFPMVECRLIYGLDEAGDPIIYQAWVGGDGDDATALEKAGLLTFAQQANTADFFMADDDDEDF